MKPKTNTTGPDRGVFRLSIVAILAVGMATIFLGACGDPPADRQSENANTPSSQSATPETGALPSPPSATLPASTQVVTSRQFLDEHGFLGKAILIEFGEVGCEKSDQGLDAMISFQTRKSVPGLSYARVEIGKNPQEADAYYADKQPPFPVLKDPEGNAAKAFEASAIPTFVLMDQFGRVRYRGKLPDRFDLYNWVDALAYEEKDPGPDAPFFGARELDAPKLLASTRLPDLMREVRPLRDYAGENGLMLIFVNTNCPFAGQAIGETPTVSATLAERRIRTVMINLNDAEDIVAEFYSKQATGAPVLYDVGTGTQLRWNVQMVPTVMLVSAADKIVYNGPAAWAEVGAAAAGVLGLSASEVPLSVQGTGQG